jgi:Protein of unknown function (DUF2911)
MRKFGVMALALVASTSFVVGQQQQRPASPTGSASTTVGGQYVKTERGQRYEGGKWIEITYSRPILRGRTGVFGSGAEYGKTLNAGAPVWRAGADVSTRLKTETPLEIGGKTVPPGEYSLFVELKNDKEWNLIVSSHAAQQKYDPNNKAALWGAYNYTPDKDVTRAPMKVESIPFSVDQLTWGFTDVSNTGGTIRLWWEKVMASVPFRVATS